MAFFNRYGILSMSDVEHRDEKSFQQYFVLPGSSDGYTPSLAAQSCAFLALGPRESLRNTLIRAKSNNKQLFEQTFLGDLSKAENELENLQEEFVSYFYKWLVWDAILIDSVHLFFSFTPHTSKGGV